MGVGRYRHIYKMEGKKTYSEIGLYPLRIYKNSDREDYIYLWLLMKSDFSKRISRT